MKKRLQNGIRLRQVNVIIAVVAAMLALLLFALSYQTLTAFRLMQDAGERYAAALGVASDMQEASGYLTDRARTFVSAGDIRALNDYVTEMNETRRRDKARSNIQQIMAETATAEYLEEALRLSNVLAPVEYRAMRLAAEAYGVSLEGYPALLEVELTAEEQGMMDEEKLAYARSLLFDENYQSVRGRVVANVRDCVDTMLNEMWSRQKNSESHFKRLLVGEAFLVAAELLLMFFIMLAVRFMVIEPMEKVVRAIEGERTVAVHTGAYELQFLSQAYNTLVEQLAQQREELFYRASHDHLTGLYNRAVFDKVCSQNERRAHTMILVDVDRFKTINDTYGHGIGDQVLQKVSRAMQNTFRSEDYICRIGGDEFAIIMIHSDSQYADLVQQKLEAMAALLRDTSDGLPELTLSIGVAFSDKVGPDGNMYKSADAALYAVKANGTDGISFF